MDDKIKEFLTTLKNPRWANESDDKIIEFDAIHNGQEVVFWASPHDLMEYGRDIHSQALNGDFGSVREFVRKEIHEETQKSMSNLSDAQKAEQEKFDKRVAEAVAKALGKENKDMF